MKKLLFATLCLSALASCQNSGTADKTTTAAAPTTAPVATPQTTCFYLADGRDTTWARITVNTDNSVTGTYSWTPYESHGANGTLSGKKEGDLLKLMYEYEIEGSQQKEEMYFRLAGDHLLEGSGELEEGADGTLHPKDPTKLAFDKKLMKTVCTE